VLGVLVVVYVFNFLDRQILSILAERIKLDLGLTDAQLGYLYGTAFAVFYAVFGIPLGRLADVWDRRLLISIGLAFWSAMTALSGLAGSFAHLALARIGVGVGEASASPAAYSLLSDYFPPARRATVLAVYASGIYIGSGIGLGIGGLVVDRWDLAFPSGTAPFGLRGWQVAFFVVGLPGLLLSLWVRSLREPRRGQSEGVSSPDAARPFAEFGRELMAAVPPFTLLGIGRREGAAGVARNLAAGLAIASGAWALTRWLGNPAQWVSLGFGLYAAVSWAQGLRARDAPTFALVFGSPAFVWSSLAFALVSFTGYGYGFWTAPYLIRTLGANAAQTGFVLGGIAAVCGWVGVTLGGVLADRLRRRSPTGRLQVGMLTAVLPLPFALVLVTTDSVFVGFAINVPMYVFTAMWLGPATATVQDLVLPRMRATASAAFLLVVTFIGLALGPYAIGRLSMATGSLRTALLCSLGANVLALGCCVMAARHLPHDERTKLERARAAGEGTIA
jgi:MFS family permease